MNFPKELKYSKSHEYIKVEGNKATIGITSYASNELGDVVFIELPDIGKSFNSGDKFGVVESVKSVSDLYIPVSGKIVEINKELSDHPEYVNQDPYGKGWLLRVRPFDKNALELLNADEYSKVVASEAH